MTGHLDSSVCDGARPWTVRRALVNGARSVFMGAIVADGSRPREHGFTIRFAGTSILLEVVFLSAASFCSIGYRSGLLEHSLQPLVLIAFTGLAMGTRNAAVRKLAIPDLTTTVLTLTVTGIAADSSFRERRQPEIGEKSRFQSWHLFRGSGRCSPHTLLDLSGVGSCDGTLRRVHVLRYFAHCVRPISCERRVRFLEGSRT